MNILYTNSNGIFNKINELALCSKIYNSSIICISETHLTSKICNSEISIGDYNIFRKDRIDGKNGGSCIFVHKSVSAELLEDFNAPDSVGIVVTLNKRSYKILCIYRSQNLEPDEQLKLISEIKKTKVSTSEELIVCGDFNLPEVKWDSWSVNCPDSTKNRVLLLQKQYLELFATKGLTNCLSDGTVTRRRMVDGVLQESLLDQVLVSNIDTILNTETVSPLGKSDHLGVLVTLKIQNDINFIKTQKENWAKFPETDISRLGDEIDWSYTSINPSSNAMWLELTDKISSISGHVPKSTIKCSKNGEILSKPPWDTSALKRKRKEKDHAWSNFDTNPNSVKLNIAMHKQKVFENKQSEAVLAHEKKIIGNMKTNPKALYSYFNSKRNIKESVSTLKDKKGVVSSSPKNTADLLGNFFSSTFVNEPYGPLEEECYKQPTTVIGDLEFTEENVKLHLLKINKSKSMGPDGVHPKVLATLAKNDSFVNAITLLFKKCFESSCIPDEWKTANVRALHKKGSKTDPSNYRPISLTCIMCKVYEKIIRTHILSHVLSKITSKQHGFMFGKSCLSNLLESVDFINDMLAKGECVDIFYLDFQKAFDTVPHYRLLEKLLSFGIANKTLYAIKDFLANRTFNVVVGNHKSENYSVTSGIPQGSVLGPLLFVLYINDLPDCIKSFVSLFADDLKMYAFSKDKNNNQTDLDQLVHWQNKWLLQFNTKDKKCKVLHIGKGNPCNEYFLNGILLPVVLSEKDLGVLISNDWKWNQHIASCVNKANSCIAWITRNVISRSPEVMNKLYKSLVRPHLEYCVQLWSPMASHGNWASIMSMEDVQRSFTRMIDGHGLLTYEQRLQSLGLTTLLERRARGDLIETFKILNGISNYGQNFFRTSRSGKKLISRPGDEKSTKYSFFARRVINYWNKLPSQVTDAKSTDCFKSRLEKFKIENFHVTGNYWELSQEIFSRIPNQNRTNYVEFMRKNPKVAKCRKINIK